MYFGFVLQSSGASVIEPTIPCSLNASSNVRPAFCQQRFVAGPFPRGDRHFLRGSDRGRHVSVEVKIEGPEVA